jgi:flagellar protein FliO/FliZ
MNPSAYIGPLAAFVLILALIPAALWLLKRTPLGGAGSGSGLRLVAALPLAPNQRIVTVEVGSGDDRRWLVLGVTPAGIQTLHTLPPQAEPPITAATPLLLFAQLLQRHRGTTETGSRHAR